MIETIGLFHSAPSLKKTFCKNVQQIPSFFHNKISESWNNTFQSGCAKLEHSWKNVPTSIMIEGTYRHKKRLFGANSASLALSNILYIHCKVLNGFLNHLKLRGLKVYHAEICIRYAVFIESIKSRMRKSTSSSDGTFISLLKLSRCSLRLIPCDVSSSIAATSLTDVNIYIANTVFFFRETLWRRSAHL